MRVWKRCDNLLLSDFGTESAILDKERGLYFGLDEVGTTVWTALEGGATEEELLQRVCEEYEVDKEQAHRDLTDFLQELEELALAHHRSLG